MIMNRWLLLGIYFITIVLPAQIDFKLFSNLDLAVNQSRLDLDTSDFKILQIPVLGFAISTYSNPRISDFISIKDNALRLNLNDYQLNVDDYSHHLIDVQNNLFMYQEKYNDNIYSFGLTHRIFSEFIFSKQFISILINGNSNYLNETIYFSDDCVRAYNYFSLFVGYSRVINDAIQLGGKLRLIKGHNSFGIDNNNSSILFSEHFATMENPFSMHLNSDVNSFITNNTSFLSNVGIAFDLNFSKKTNYLNLYVDISELGFIHWTEDQYISQGDFYFDGVDYSLDQTLSSEFSSLYDTIINIFDLEEKKDIKSLRLLPFDINIGVNRGMSNDVGQINFNYNLKKLYKGLLHTGTISYTQKIIEYQLGITPMYSINKFNYTNFGILINKQWKHTLYTNLYLDNIFGLFNNIMMSNRFGMGVEFFVLF